MNYHSAVVSTVEKDAEVKAVYRLAQFKAKRGGKFKISEAQFVEELKNMWMTGEFSAAERILRHIESDEAANTKDLIRGEIHIFLLDLFAILKKRMDIKRTFGLDDLLWGRYTTEKVMASREENGS